MSTPNLSILIITYNRPEDTLALLEDLNTQEGITDYVSEILILNNASTVSYESVEMFIEKHPELPVEYIDHDENLGVARGRNFLIPKAKSPFLLVLDDDVEFEKRNAIQEISGLFEKKQYQDNNTAVITLNIHYFETRERQKSAFPHKKYDKYRMKQWFLTSYYVGAAHLMRKELFEETGLYPEDFFYGMEEYDLSYRIIDEGYTLAYDNSVKVLHKESPKGRVPAKEKLAMMWYNKCVVMYTYLPKKYFYSTAFFWIWEYLRKTNFDIKGAYKNLKKIAKIPKERESNLIGEKAMKYLKKTEARLWY